jgi:hypothetical protein
MTYLPTNTFQSTPENPTGTTSTAAFVMMGLAGSITPKSTGKILIIISGHGSNTVAADGVKMQIRFGTGAAPANGAASTGTAAGGAPIIGRAQAATVTVPFSCNGIASGLTIGTTYWVDLSIAAVTGGTGSVANLSISVEETG